MRLVLSVLFMLVQMQAALGDESIRFDKYHNNAEFTEHLQWLAKTYPNLVELEELGKSPAGEPIWGVTVTNKSTGPHHQKPGMYVDGNTHDGEVAGGEAGLHLVHVLATKYGSDPLVTEALDHFSYYVIPRVNPDNAEIYLTGTYPKNPNPRDNDGDGRFDEDPPEDVNGDGIISYMRIRDPNGPLRTHPEDPRLMVARKGGEPGEWRMIGREGRDNDGDGKVNEDAPDPLGSVSNRNYPVGWWSPDELKHGQGRYPLSEPEAKVQVDFAMAHPNINGLTTYHTHSGVILRPYAHKADDLPLARDLPYFRGIGEVGTEITGYPLISSFHSFTPDPTRPRLGTYKDWGYVHRGLIAWTIELWKAPGEEGLSAFEGLDEMKMLAFIDEKLGGRDFVPWKRYDHPVYGEVEIGGLEQNFIIQNPPPEYLEQELEKVTKFAIVQGMMSALVRITEVRAEDLGDGIFKVRASIQNQGFLPTAIERAKTLGLDKPVEVELKGGEVLSDPLAHDLGTLQGWGPVGGTRPSWGFTGEGAPVHHVSWIVRGKAGDELSVEARSERGGWHEKKVKLGQ